MDLLYSIAVFFVISYHFLSYISMYKLKIQVIGMFVSSCLRVFLERVFRFFLRFPETFDIIKAIYIIILTLALYHLICIAIFVLSACAAFITNKATESLVNMLTYHIKETEN